MPLLTVLLARAASIRRKSLSTSEQDGCVLFGAQSVNAAP